ncbi:Clp protease N-terminal domain-containing protein [Nonomuraea sp. NPDC050663]|uniref:Clp protease N-terminal domain-containing protein n=1 Tax=Nonomuraea sp. NPDC050663 TaxID=3364370 RepID=UPI00378E68A5
MKAFDEFLHLTLTQAGDEARREGSATIEAQHVLLAIAAGHESVTLELLASSGLDYQALREALHREFEHSLAAAGVRLAPSGPPAASPHPSRGLQMGASARTALERGVFARHKKDLRPAHLLIGILGAEVGTVPRALALAGVDRHALVTRAHATLPPAA